MRAQGKSWLFWVVLLTGTIACRRVDAQKFRRLEAAGNGIEATIGSKADLPRFRQVTTEFSRELDALRPQAQSGPEVALIKQYDEVDRELKDMLAVWELRAARDSDLLPLSDATASRIKQTYDLGVNTNDPPSIYAAEALQTIWDDAKAKLERAGATLHG